MDIQDVSHDAQYVQVLNAQKTRLEAAHARKGEKPRDRQTRQNLTRRHMNEYREAEAMKSSRSTTTYMRATMIGEPYLPSVAPVKSLKKMMIDDLTLETHHRGFYLLLRLFVPPLSITAVITLAEDETGDAVKISLYQQETADVRKSPEVLPKDTVILLKEPYFKIVGDGGYGLRVDHPTDIVYLSSDDPIFPQAWKKESSSLGAEDWKQRGNTNVQINNFRDAIRDNSPTPLEAEIIHNNRALVYLRLQQYDAALRDSSFIPNPENRSEKALYRGSLALYNLGRYAECRKLLQILTSKYPTSESGKYELARVQLRLHEQKSGVYNFKKMYKAVKLRPPLIDSATFVGAVEIRDIPGKGRGLVTKNDFKAGDLIFCEKAFSYGYADRSGDGTSGGDIGILMNLGTNRMTVGTHVSQLPDIYQKLQNNPSSAAEFLALYSGTYERAPVQEIDGLPVVDSFLIERILALNVFGSALTSKDAYFKTTTKEDSLLGSSGLWILASYINHSCIQNCSRNFIGDMMIVRATEDLPANTELGWCYADPMNRAKMKKSLQDSWGFTCTCLLCQDELKTPKKLMAKRRHILSSMGTRDPRAAATEMEKTHISPTKDVPRLELFQTYFAIAQHFIFEDDNANPFEGLLYGLKALDALGFILDGVDMKRGWAEGKRGLAVKRWGCAVQPLAKVWETLWTVWKISDPNMALAAEKYWQMAYAMVQAGESDTFATTYDLKRQKETMGSELARAIEKLDLETKGCR
ncbi:hypothetical protein QTJ16_003491 [Diplocarpon rosae]|uniref:SET domain-containing protein n=1 Tax=Diplocarpon rosae TaxID=946125 RepID=A0AAD9WDN7_9HELO|nr:hypothetical protein QTJ16_003491 [Diplocarpon rosae]